MSKIVLAEPIHKVVQGEGVNTNKKMMLLRVLGCPIKCKGCDSPQTWNQEDINTSLLFEPTSLADEIISLTQKYGINHVMLTGGEPLLYIKEIREMFKYLMPKHVLKWDIETTGVEDWDALRWFWEHIQFNFSPKIGSLKGDKDWDWKGLYPNVRPPHYIVKIVSSQKTFEEDLKAIKELKKQYLIPSKKIYLMPMGTRKEEIIEESKFLIDKAWENNFEFSSRQHILIYNDLKKV